MGNNRFKEALLERKEFIRNGLSEAFLLALGIFTGKEF